MSIWPDSPLDNPICVFFHGKVSLTVNRVFSLTELSVRFCWQPSSLHLGRICPRAQSYVVLPQAWFSPYQCLHMLPPFGQDVASVAPFSGRLASLPSRQAVTTNRKDLKPSFTEGRNPFRFPLGKEQRLGYLQQRCTQWSRWAPRLANLRRGSRKVATSCMAFVCHALACQHATILNHRWLPGTRLGSSA